MPRWSKPSLLPASIAGASASDEALMKLVNQGTALKPQTYDGLADAYAFDRARWHEAEALARKAVAIDKGLAEPG